MVTLATSRITGASHDTASSKINTVQAGAADPTVEVFTVTVVGVQRCDDKVNARAASRAGNVTGHAARATGAAAPVNS